VGGLSLSQHLDQDGRVEEQNGSAHPAGIRMPLGVNPLRRVFIPVVPLVLDRPDRGEDLVPSPLIVKGAPEHARDEGAAPALSDSAVQFGHELIFEAYV